MPRIRMLPTVLAKGPIFRSPGAEIEAFRDRADEAVAQAAFDAVKQRLNQVLKNPTGYYESRVVKERTAAGWETHDSGVVYGPWLEGTGSRNRTTRFKGYRTFRIVKQDIARQVPRIIKPELQRLRKELNT